jgi:Transcriptional regulatory protein, C terminal
MRQQANLRVRVLGVLGVAVDGHEVAPVELASRKGRTLLKLLLARRGAVVPAEVLVEALWGGRPPADPDANLATLVSRLRAVLGPDAIAGDRQGWRFVAGGRVEVDLDEAERLAGEAEARLAGEPALALPPPSAPSTCWAAARSWPTSPTPTGPSRHAARPSAWPPGPAAWPGTPPWPWPTTPAPSTTPAPPPPPIPSTRPPGAPS